jgi:hypothetical protein
MHLRNNILYTLLLLALLVTAFAINQYYFDKGVYSISIDESIRSHRAFKWYMAKWPVESDIYWPPGLAIINGAAYHVLFDQFRTPRIIGLIFGLVYIIAIAILTKTIYPNRMAIFMSAFLATFFSERAALTLVPLAELPATVFFLFSFIFFIKYIKVVYLKKHRKMDTWRVIFALTSCFAGSISGIIRFEYLLWLAILGIMIFFVEAFYPINKKISHSMIFVSGCAVIICSVPVFLIANAYFQNKDINDMLTIHTNRYLKFHPEMNIQRLKHSIPLQFIYESLSCGLIGSILGIIHCFYKKTLRRKILLISFLPIVIIFVTQCIMSVRGVNGTHNFWRQVFSYTTLLIPFFAIALSGMLDGNLFFKAERQNEKIPKKFAFKGLVAIFFLMYIMLNYSNMSYLIERSTLAIDQEQKKAGDIIKDIIQDDEFIIEDGNVILTGNLLDTMNLNAIASLKSKIINARRSDLDASFDKITLMVLQDEDIEFTKNIMKDKFGNFSLFKSKGRYSFFSNAQKKYNSKILKIAKAMHILNRNFDIENNNIINWKVEQSGDVKYASLGGVLCVQITSESGHFNISQEVVLDRGSYGGDIIAEIAVFALMPEVVELTLRHIVPDKTVKSIGKPIPIIKNTNTDSKSSWSKVQCLLALEKTSEGILTEDEIVSLQIKVGKTGDMPVFIMCPEIRYSEVE